MATCPTCRAHFADTVESCPQHGVALMPDQAFLSADSVLVAGHKVGDYMVEDVVAEGGFGTVYRVIHPVIGKSAAIKVLKREFSSNPEMVSRFIAEARAVNQIRHKNIIDIFAFGVLDDGRHYFVMELLEGITLDQLVQTEGRMSVIDALPIVRQLGRALSAAHAAGITHRDLKPENVLVIFDEDGGTTPKLLDFGIAKLRDTPSSTHKTRSGTPMGTPLYMSPEQVYGREIDHRCDIYALGILIHELLTGAPPFDGASVMQVLTAHTTQKPPPMSSLVPGLPPELDAPVLHMLEKDPNDRPQSVSAALDELFVAAERCGAAPAQSRRSGKDLPHITRPDMRVSKPRESVTSAATTLPADNKVRPSGAPSPIRRRVLLGGAVVALAGGLAIVAVVRRSGAQARPLPDVAGSSSSDVANVPPSDAPITPARTVDPTPPSTSAVLVAPAASVKLTFEGLPDGSEVLRDGKSLKLDSHTIELPLGAERVKLTLKRAGYLSRDVWVVPDKDRTIATSLTKTSPQPRGPSGDLEF